MLERDGTAHQERHVEGGLRQLNLHVVDLALALVVREEQVELRPDGPSIHDVEGQAAAAAHARIAGIGDRPHDDGAAAWGLANLHHLVRLRGLGHERPVDEAEPADPELDLVCPSGRVRGEAGDERGGERDAPKT